MNQSDTPSPETQSPRDRLSRLSEARLRINGTLEFDNVLQEVVESARTLTGARYGMMATLDQSGGSERLFSSGTTAEEHRQLEDTPGRIQFFEHIRRFPEPMRVSDFSSHLRSMGLGGFRPPWPVGAFLAVPIRHQREDVGNIYLAREPDEAAFTREDEETLALFASQAALVIANARRYRDEQLARPRLETLIDTSPVGVAVFDARTGAPLSFNREAVRLMEAVRLPDRPPEDLLQVLTVRRFDGQAVSLADFPLAQVLSSGETVRAEEIVLSVPDGRSVTPLHVAPHQVVDAGDALGGHSEADNPRFGRRGLPRRPVVGPQIAAIAEVATGVGPFPACLFQLLPAAVAMIGVALFHQPSGQAVVDVQSLRLEVRAVGAVHLRAFVPIDVQPA